MGCLGGYTQDPSYSTWERVWQAIIKQYISIEDKLQALEEIEKVYL